MILLREGVIELRSVAVLWVTIFSACTVLLGWVIVPRVSRWRNRPRRHGECCECGAQVTGRSWWTLARGYTGIGLADIDETGGSGGTIMSVDYCSRHRPTVIPDEHILIHH